MGKFMILFDIFMLIKFDKICCFGTVSDGNKGN